MTLAVAFDIDQAARVGLTRSVLARALVLASQRPDCDIEPAILGIAVLPDSHPDSEFGPDGWHAANQYHCHDSRAELASPRLTTHVITVGYHSHGYEATYGVTVDGSLDLWLS